MTPLNRTTIIGAVAGAVIAFVWAWLGFGAIILIVVLASLGGLIGYLVSQSSTDDAIWRAGACNEHQRAHSTARRLGHFGPPGSPKLAARAAAKVPGAHEVSVRGLPSLLAPLHRSTSTADAAIEHDIIRLVLHIEVEWPAPLASVARRARDEVRSTVFELVGLDVGAVEVRVEHLVGAERRPQPRVR
jgi:uncharacterized membrane protein/uncharacterized alkaline shock family protein YloU